MSQCLCVLLYASVLTGMLMCVFLCLSVGWVPVCMRLLKFHLESNLGIFSPKTLNLFFLYWGVAD